jgi:PEGA domain
MKTSFCVMISVLAITLSLSNCATVDNSLYSSSSKVTKFTVEIVSEPAGAVIEINDNYLGKTPITVELEGWKSTRTFCRNHILVAHPVRDGGQVQVKSFIGWTEPSKTYGDKIPDKIFFDMNLVRITK